MRKALTIVSTTAFVLSLSACDRNAEKTAESARQSADNAVDTAGNVASNAVVATKMDALTPTPAAQELVNRAAQSDAFEIAAAKLAAKNAASKDVKSFAAEMTKAHTASTATIKSAAAKASPAITPDPALTSDQQGKLDDLGKLTGADFDNQYISGQVDAHEDALSLLNDYAKNGDLASLRDAAAGIAPTVQKHLEKARALRQ